MRDDEPSLAEEEIPVDDSEASEADGVEIEMTAPYLLPDDVGDARPGDAGGAR
jgi:hypothetical protein